jgi:hypothetical protein
VHERLKWEVELSPSSSINTYTRLRVRRISPAARTAVAGGLAGWQGSVLALPGAWAGIWVSGCGCYAVNLLLPRSTRKVPICLGSFRFGCRHEPDGPTQHIGFPTLSTTTHSFHSHQPASQPAIQPASQQPKHLLLPKSGHRTVREEETNTTPRRNHKNSVLQSPSPQRSLHSHQQTCGKTSYHPP